MYVNGNIVRNIPRNVGFTITCFDASITSHLLPWWNINSFSISLFPTQAIDYFLCFTNQNCFSETRNHLQDCGDSCIFRLRFFDGMDVSVMCLSRWNTTNSRDDLFVNELSDWYDSITRDKQWIRVMHHHISQHCHTTSGWYHNIKLNYFQDFACDAFRTLWWFLKFRF